MSVTRRAIQSLTTRDKTSFVVTVAIRMATNILDILGLLLVGVTVTLLTAPNVENPTFVRIQEAFALFNFEINYVFVAALAVVFFLLKSALAMYLNKLIAKFVARIEADRATKAFSNVLNSNLDELSQWDEKDLLHGVSGSANMAFGQSLLLTSIILGETGLLLGVSAYLIYVHWQLFLAMLIYFAVFGALMTVYVSRRTSKSSTKLLAGTLDSQRILLDSVANIRQVQALGKQSQFVQRFKETRVFQAQAGGEMVNLGYLPRYLTEVALIFGVALFIVFKSVFGQVGVPFDVLAIFVAGAFRIIASLLPLAASIGTIRRVEAEGSLADKLFNLDSGRLQAESRVSGVGNRGNAIEFNGVSYVYPNSDLNILDNVNLAIARGEFVAIVGRSGAGKSTLADLMLGLRTPTSGIIRVNGFDTENRSGTVQGAISYAPQHPLLVAGSVAENVTFNVSDHEVNGHKLNAALDMVNLQSVVMSLPDGVNTSIGIAGSGLSGGQIQRIGLARAIYSDSEILVLDEITSALDKETEEVVRTCIENLAKTKTLIVITHNMATVRRASRVLVVADGTVHDKKPNAVTKLELEELS